MGRKKKRQESRNNVERERSIYRASPLETQRAEVQTSVRQRQDQALLPFPHPITRKGRRPCRRRLWSEAHSLPPLPHPRASGPDVLDSSS